MCGVFGVVAPGGDAARLAALGLFALQHRGQESAGIAASDGDQLMLYKDLGMIAQVLDERRFPSLPGQLAIAHCRYSTTGSTVWENAQPTLRLGPRRALAIGHNGNLVNTRELLDRLPGGRSRLPASTDTELLTALLADEPAADTAEALVRVLPQVRGAYSLVVLDERRLIGVRDPHGFRPLVLGRLPVTPETPGLRGDPEAGGGWVLSSETAGLDVVGADFVRDVEPGELVILEPGSTPRSVRFAEARPALCVFELIYFARPAVGRLVPAEVATIVAGVAAGCRLAGCALLGGETAEHPGVMRPDDLDLAATCVGVVERDDLIDGREVGAGDVLVGLPSSGLHSNGFSLVRRLVEDAGLDLDAPYAAVLRHHAPGEQRRAGRERLARTTRIPVTDHRVFR